MSNRLFGFGRQYFGSGDADWDAHTFNVVPLRLDGTLTDTSVKAITGCTVATPGVITSNSHGFTTGDIVVIRGVGGTLNANGTFMVGTTTTNTFELKTLDNANTTTVGAYTSGGCVINLSSADFVDDIDGAFCTGAAALASAVAISGKTNVKGLLSGAAVVGITLNDTAHAVMIIDNKSNAAATSLPIHFCDGRTMVRVVAAASSSATSIAVEPLEGTVPSGSVIQMTNGVAVTTTATGNPGDRTLSCSALSAAIAAGHHGDVQTLNSGYPLSVAASTFTHTPDATYGFFTL